MVLTVNTCAIVVTERRATASRAAAAVRRDGTVLTATNVSNGINCVKLCSVLESHKW